MKKSKPKIPYEPLTREPGDALVIEFAVRKNGKVPVDEYLKKLRKGNPSNANWAVQTIAKLKKHGLNFNVAWLKPLQNRGGMFEITNTQKKIRILGYRPTGRKGVVVLSLGFFKNQEAADDQKYDSAESIKREYEEQIRNVRN